MADSPERIAAGLRYLQEKAPADPLGSFRSVAAFKDAYQPVLNNARQFFATGAGLGELLRAYAAGAAPAQAAVAKGMGIPYGGPMTAPREEGVTSDENFRPMGNAKQQLAGQMLGDPTNLLPMVGPAARGVVAAGKAAAPRIARGLEQHLVNTGGMLPMDTWHGSPYRFPPTAKNPLGEFDPMKVGTGEGAQAYGVGAGYLAEEKGVGGGYAKTLGIQRHGPGYQTTFRGEAVSPIRTPNYTEVNPEEVIRHAHEAYGLAGKSSDQKAEAVIRISRRLFPDAPLAWEDKLDELARATKKEDFGTKAPGYLYKVDLPDEQIAKMLDWDKPLSQQAPGVRKAFLSTRKNLTPMDIENLGSRAAVNRLYGMDNTVGDFLGTWQSLRGSKDAGEKMLRDAGIPGIRYLDGGSRGAGQGTSNFVVFDPAHMNILERNGVTAASLRKVAPQDEALRLAQQRAALPVEQHGLGLPAGNTAMDRANVMFPTDVYHATMNDFPKFDLGKAGKGTTITKAEKAVFSSNNPSVANEFVAGPYYNNNGIVDRFYPAGSNVMPLKIRSDSASLWDMYGRGYDADFVKQAIKDARKSKDDTVVFNKMRDPGFTTAGQGELSSIVGSLNPDNIRSRFAAFDPFRRNAALAAALGVAAPDLLAKEKVKK